jgi:hypothetical protein
MPITKCPKCGFEYVAGIPGDTHAHREYHDETVNGVRAEPLENDGVIWRDGAYRITIVNHTSPVERKRIAEKTGIVANRDLRYDFKPFSAAMPADERNVHVFLLHHGDRAVGLLIAERCSKIWRCTWEEYANAATTHLLDHPSIWSVALVWANQRHRHKGLGYRLAVTTASYLGIPIQQLGWQTPFTPSGMKMVQRLCPDVFYIAK